MTLRLPLSKAGAIVLNHNHKIVKMIQSLVKVLLRCIGYSTKASVSKRGVVLSKGSGYSVILVL